MKFIASIAAATAAFALAGAAQAADRLCSGEAKNDETLASVEVTFRVDDKGVVKSREATWAIGSATGGLGMLTGEPTVTVEYANPTEQGLGAASGLHAFSMVMTNDAKVFAGAQMVFELPDGRSWRADPITATGTDNRGNVTFVMVLGDIEPAKAADLFADLEMVGQARVSFRRGDQALKTVTVDFRGRPERDEMFRKAWAAAMKAAEKPRKCEKAKD